MPLEEQKQGILFVQSAITQHSPIVSEYQHLKGKRLLAKSKKKKKLPSSKAAEYE